MSVLIKGMEMPKMCSVCPCACEVDGSCHITGYKPTFSEWYEDGVKDCPLVEIPPHGRLIEKNAVFELIRSFPSVDRQLPVEFMKALYELPTIIEAEEGE